MANRDVQAGGRFVCLGVMNEHSFEAIIKFDDSIIAIVLGRLDNRLCQNSVCRETLWLNGLPVSI